ncbi:uncharacterized protein LOC116618539 [Nematostella vectensis]|uniref:uncharacterized protein LOC116618539 n=1 Tax=Nematostella vectensis TaxID=45351 RepID=UPI0013900511|nr:uncharacterized protein LOC116618539 [Nematostella vectensis]
MRTYLENVDVDTLVSSKVSCQDKVKMLETIVEKALAQGDQDRYRLFRNCVNRERKVCRAKFYNSKVECLKDCKPATWWREVKKLSGISAPAGGNGITNLLHHIADDSVAESQQAKLVRVANTINEAFLEPIGVFSPLPPSAHAHFPPDVALQKLSALNPRKASGPDGIPGWVLNESADLLATSVTDILNCFFREARLPQSWKDANITPVPKQKPISDVNKHLRPIFLTPVLSKVAEDYVVEHFVKPAILAKVDRRQFGTVPGSNTTHALISMIHSWLSATDGNGATVRAILLDFRKAFDLIDHRILVDKLHAYDIPHSVISWIVDFLSCRRQRVKLGQDCFSEWGAISSGVINDLDAQGVDLWKYVDDTTLAEVVNKGEECTVQHSLDELSCKVATDRFQLNEAKCKELRISFKRTTGSTTAKQIVEQYNDVCSGDLGTLEGKQHLDVDPTVPPNIAPSRRVPFALKPQLEAELQRLTDIGVIVPVDEPTD